MCTSRTESLRATMRACTLSDGKPDNFELFVSAERSDEEKASSPVQTEFRPQPTDDAFGRDGHGTQTQAGRRHRQGDRAEAPRAIQIVRPQTGQTSKCIPLHELDHDRRS